MSAVNYFNELLFNYPWFVKTFRVTDLKSISDAEIEEAILLARDYAVNEEAEGGSQNKMYAKKYYEKIEVAEEILEKRLKVDAINEYRESLKENNNNDSDGSESSGGGLKGALNKYKWYILGTLILGTVGIIVIRKI